MSIIPPPHPRSSSQPPPLLRRLVEEPHAPESLARRADEDPAAEEPTLVKMAEQDPAGEEPTLVKIPKLEDFVPDEVEITPLRHDYPPADLQAYRRTVPTIPPPPPTADFSSWPPTVLEAREKSGVFLTSVLARVREYVERGLAWSEDALDQVRAACEDSWARLVQVGLTQVRQARSGLARSGLARSGRAQRWALPNPPPRAWLRASAPYAFGMLGVLVALGLLLPGSLRESKRALQASSAVVEAPIRPAPATNAATPAKSITRASTERSAPPRLSMESTLLLALAENLMDAGRDAEAVPVLERALARTAGIVNDPTFLRIVKRGALSEDRLAATQVHALLIGPMGERGAEILYEISTSRSARKGVRERAVSFIYTKDFENKAPLPLYAAFKLLTAPTCEGKKSLLAFAAEAGGRHALDYLRELDEHKVCSLDDFDNCYPCMNLDDALPRAIEKIEARLGT